MAKNEVIRSYSFSDAVMLQASRVMQGLFVEDKAAFIGFDSDFNDPFADNWQSKITDAGETDTDNSYTAELTEKTRIVSTTMELCKNHFQKLKYFVEKAFPDHKEIWNQFGFGDYDDARRSEVKMVRLFGLAHKAAIQYTAELTAAGLAEGDIQRIKTLQDELTTADYEQEKHKKKRPSLTQERITALNECYEFMHKVNKAAKIIFAADYAKYNQYLLPNESPAKVVEEPAPSSEQNA